MNHKKGHNDHIEPNNKDHNQEEDNHGNHHQIMIADFKKRFFASLILTIPILLLSPMIQEWGNFNFNFNGDKYILFFLATAIYIYGGKPFLVGLRDELKEKSPGMMTLIAMAISVAYLYSSATVFGLEGKDFFWELATLIDIMLLGHWIEMKSIMSASNALSKLAKLMPDTAHVYREGDFIDIDVNELKIKDKIQIKPGEKIPADGIIIKGKSQVNESMLTGESKPVDRNKGEEVVGGSINGEGSLEVEVKNIGEDSYISKVIHMVESAQKSKSKTQHLADKAAFWLTIVALVVGFTTLVVWYIITKDFTFAIARMATVMVITCPHALGLATPLVVATSTAQAAKNGLLIRNRTQFENARKVDTLVFDKTGTLTHGKFEVNYIEVFNNMYYEDKIIALGSSLESKSEHPIATGILKKKEEKNLNLQTVEDFKAIKGTGLEGIIEGSKIMVVSPRYLREHNIDIPRELPDRGNSTDVFLLVENKLVAAIGLSDKIRKESYQAIKKLRKQGIKTWMLTGDNEKTAEIVSKELGLDGYFAEVLPDQKLQKIKELQKKGQFVAMTGDGVNDAPALAQADVGIAIGSGTDVAAETADIILVNSNPEDVVSLISFGKKTYKKMIQNLIWATGYNVISIPLAAGVL
ncbi:MAG: copper-translocating P-type ATPase, partial [Anaerococcus sp.]